eukprot:4452110-Amphidinium_carterae.5
MPWLWKCKKLGLWYASSDSLRARSDGEVIHVPWLQSCNLLRKYCWLIKKPVHCDVSTGEMQWSDPPAPL